ncbi:MAG TPA: aminotransferase class V-fold PLP-dependent enzyme, partial [Puia sp.]|nr:aminotransferase class V-fold PLP-dependent enzyme [Puia sp.]
MNRNTFVEMRGAEFKQAGYQLVDQIADFIDAIERKPVTISASAAEISEMIGHSSLPESGRATKEIVSRAAKLLLDHSLLNGHPKFMGYITSSAAPIGALADMLAATVNPNVGAHILSPVATAIERQVVKWLGEFIGVPACFDGILVSGGNMANFTAFFAALNTKMPERKKAGMSYAGDKLIISGGVDKLIISADKPVIYCCRSTHTWIEKAASLSGIGTDSIGWIPADNTGRIDIGLLEKTIKEDKERNRRPLMIIGTAGDVSTGAVDDLKALAAICKRNDCWFHVDGAYGVLAAVVPEQRGLFEGVADAYSIALDPHKWLYTPLEAGCTLVKDANHLVQTYSSHPVYYNFSNDEEPG